MSTPSLTAPVGGESNYTKSIAPEGMHVARIYQIIDLGTTEQGGNFPGKKRKVQILLELPNELAIFNPEKGEQPYYLRKGYTLSMNSKAILRKDVESLLGKKMTDEDAAKFNVFSLLGAPCMVQVVHAIKGDNTYANINNITPMPKGMTCPAPFNPTLVFSTQTPDMTVFASMPPFVQDKIKESDEFIAYMASQMESHGAPTPAPKGIAKPTAQVDANDLPWELPKEGLPF
jgi:hypothetical protein